MTNTFLSSEEVQALTARIVRPAQIRVLRAMGIEHRVRPDGSVAILRDHIARILDGQSVTRRMKTTQPNWDAL